MNTPTSLPAAQVTRSAQDETMDLLTHHFANDRLTLAEFERRAAAVIAARSPAELQALVVDLPATSGTAALALDSSAAPQRVFAFLSTQDRRGPLHLPRALALRCILGTIKMDLRDTRFAPGVTEIEVDAILGTIELLVPLGLRVEMHASAVLASCESDATAFPAAVRGEPRSLASDVAGAHDAEVPVLRIIGGAILSTVSVQTAVPR